MQLFGLPLTNHITASSTDYYVPGSVMSVSIDPKHPVAHGYGDTTDIFFDNSPVWTLGPNAESPESDSSGTGWYRRRGAGPASRPPRLS